MARDAIEINDRQLACARINSAVGRQGTYAVFQGTSNGGRQFLSIRRSNRRIVPIYGKSDRLFTRERKFAQR